MKAVIAFLFFLTFNTTHCISQSYSSLLDIVIEDFSKFYSSYDTIFIASQSKIDTQSTLYAVLNTQYYSTFINPDSSISCKDPECLSLFYALSDNLNFTILHDTLINLPHKVKFASSLSSLINLKKWSRSSIYSSISPLLTKSNERHEIWVQSYTYREQNTLRYLVTNRNRKWEIVEREYYEGNGFALDKNYIREIK